MPRIAQFRGDTTSHLIPLSYKGAAFSPGSAWHLIFTAKRHSEDSDADAVIQKITGAGIAVAGSNATLTIVGLDTESVEDRDLVWDIRATSIATGERRTVANGALAIIGNVGREPTTSIPILTTEPPFPGAIPVLLRSVADGRPLGGIPVAVAVGQQLRYGDASPYEWYQWDGETWEKTGVGGGVYDAYSTGWNESGGHDLTLWNQDRQCFVRVRVIGTGADQSLAFFDVLPGIISPP